MLLHNATVLTKDPNVPDLRRGDVLIDGAVIADVGANLLHRAPAGDRRRDSLPLLRMQQSGPSPWRMELTNVCDYSARSFIDGGR